jgi:hypothetical protein
LAAKLVCVTYAGGYRASALPLQTNESSTEAQPKERERADVRVRNANSDLSVRN